MRAPPNPVVEAGATIAELSKMFAMDPRDIRARLRDVPPDGMRGDATYWTMRHAAPFLMPIDETNAEVVSRILRMNSNALPSILRKEFWAGQEAELRVLEKQQHLWHTKDVVDQASMVFKTIRLSLTLLVDSLERETGLTEIQRTIITMRITQTLNDMRERLTDELRTANDNRSGASFAPEEEDDEYRGL